MSIWIGWFRDQRLLLADDVDVEIDINFYLRTFTQVPSRSANCPPDSTIGLSCEAYQTRSEPWIDNGSVRAAVNRTLYRWLKRTAFGGLDETAYAMLFHLEAVLSSYAMRVLICWISSVSPYALSWLGH